MTTVLNLAMPYFTKEFIVETNASRTGLKVVLMQGGALLFMSQVLSTRARAKSIHKTELMAIVLALWKLDVIHNYVASCEVSQHSKHQGMHLACCYSHFLFWIKRGKMYT